MSYLHCCIICRVYTIYNVCKSETVSTEQLSAPYADIWHYRAGHYFMCLIWQWTLAHLQRFVDSLSMGLLLQQNYFHIAVAMLRLIHGTVSWAMPRLKNALSIGKMEEPLTYYILY